MNKDSISKTSMDDEYPELTQADFDRAVLRQGLKPVEKKQRITIMLDAGVRELAVFEFPILCYACSSTRKDKRS